MINHAIAALILVVAAEFGLPFNINSNIKTAIKDACSFSPIGSDD
jgi:hypothetical protein